MVSRRTSMIHLAHQVRELTRRRDTRLLPLSLLDLDHVEQELEAPTPNGHDAKIDGMERLEWSLRNCVLLNLMQIHGTQPSTMTSLHDCGRGLRRHARQGSGSQGRFIVILEDSQTRSIEGGQQRGRSGKKRCQYTSTSMSKLLLSSGVVTQVGLTRLCISLTSSPPVG